MSLTKRIAYLNAASRECFEAGHIGVKLFWTIIFIMCLCLMFYNSFIIANDYINRETQTKLEVRSHKQLQFPSVGICVETPYSPKNIEQILDIVEQLHNRVEGGVNEFHDYIVSFALNGGKASHRYESLLNSEIEAAYEEFYQSHIYRKVENEIDLWKGMVLNCSETFVKCSVGPLNEFDCCSHVFETILYKAFQCFFINAPVVETQNVPGRRRSLRLHLTRDQVIPTFLKVKDEIEVQWNVYLYTSTNDKVGGKYRPLNSEPIVFEQNTINTVSIDPSYTSLMGDPYEPACKDSSIDDEGILNGHFYANHCYHFCEQKYYEEHCGCVRIDEFYGNSSTPFCSPRQTFECLRHAINDVDCVCPIPCRYSKFNAKVNSRQMKDLPSDFKTQIEEDIANNVSLEQINGKNLDITIEIFHSSLVTEHVVQVARWSLSTALSAIGSQFAFWMGIKIFTVFQVLYYFTFYRRPQRQSEPEDHGLISSDLVIESNVKTLN